MGEKMHSLNDPGTKGDRVGSMAEKRMAQKLTESMIINTKSREEFISPKYASAKA